ncbi:MAG: amidohydrolase family protein [Deltaproteobacteria bacterium]|nr:amidohydrolase family protein [Deltaproteobacteria bacterium]
MILRTPLPALNDAEGTEVPEFFHPVVDAHVHVFPEDLFRAIWKWFDEFGWPVRYQMSSEKILEFLLSRGVNHVVAFQYAHKPGISRDLNNYIAGLCKTFSGKVTGMATVFPGEKGAADILAEAFKSGLQGVKLHAHVQCFDMSSKEMELIYDICSSHEKPLVMHAGREPKSPGYSCDPYLICKAEKLERVLKEFPDLKVCVPHLGADEFLAYKYLIEKYDNLWLDTAMAITDYLPGENPVPLAELRSDRIMYGSDFPNIPYAWDRELKELAKNFQQDKILKQILAGNAVNFFSLNVHNSK